MGINSVKSLAAYKIWVGLTLALVLLILLTLFLTRPEPRIISPQVQSLLDIRSASAIPVEVHFHAGFPRNVLADVSVSGTNSLDQARKFLQRYADLYQQQHPDVELPYVRIDKSPGDHEIVRLAQEFKGIPVFGAELVVYVRNNVEGMPSRILGTSGALFVPNDTHTKHPIDREFETVPSITPEMAARAARNHFRRPDALIQGEFKLMIYDPSIFGGSPDPRLVWAVVLRGDEEPVEVLVDAKTALSRIRAFPHCHRCRVRGLRS